MAGGQSTTGNEREERERCRRAKEASWIGGLEGKVLDLLGTGFAGPTTPGDLQNSLLMSKKAPEHEDGLRSFIRANSGRSATIH